MKLLIIAVGKISSSAPENKIIQEYLKRILWKVEIRELEPENNSKKTAEKILKAIPKGFRAILLDKDGRNYSSEEFATYLNNLGNAGASSIAFLIGGAEGFHKNIYTSIKDSISFGKMTYAHKLARIILVEQIYRAWAISNNHPYHK